MDKKVYRYKKWAHLFDFLDLDQDGVLSFEEFLHFSVKLITSGQVENGTRLALLYNTYWNKTLQGAGIEVSTLQMDVATFQIGNDSVSQSQWFKSEFIPGMISVFFDSVDTDHDGKISFTEWRNLFQKRGITDEAFIKSTFNKMDKNADGIISREEFQYAYEMFGFGEDETQDYSFLYNKRL